MTAARPADAPATDTIALFISCLADLLRPAAAEAALSLLEDAGYRVEVPTPQSCCGQPGYNSGDYEGAAAIARQTVAQFEGYRYVVVPSGSCAGMLRLHYPRLLEGSWRERAEALAGRVFELTSFLHDIAGYRPPAQADAGSVAYHDGCAGLRELGVREQPRALLAAAGYDVKELGNRDTCCGFGGTFCARMPAISAHMADDKLRDIDATGANEVAAGDLGCLLALAGRARRMDSDLAFRHVAELLAASAASPIASPAGRRRSARRRDAR
jgi:L-lactate dehydrogenase complex protein LldE